LRVGRGATSPPRKNITVSKPQRHKGGQFIVERPLQGKSFVLKQEEVEIEEASQSSGVAASQRKTSHVLVAELGELMYSQERSGGN
jgi:hypothetical protein